MLVHCHFFLVRSVPFDKILRGYPLTIAYPFRIRTQALPVNGVFICVDLALCFSFLGLLVFSIALRCSCGRARS